MASTLLARLATFHALARVLFVACLAAACQRDAAAQVAYDPLGPVKCFYIVDAKQLSDQSALELCAGAISDAPGRCYAEAVDVFHNLSTQQVLQLCQSATSMQPLACFDRLDKTGVLTEGQMIAYCTTACAVGPAPPEASSAACLDLALERTDLSLKSAGDLCLRSRSTGPVECYVAGQNIHKLADSSLVELCAETGTCQYYNAAPAAY